MNNEGFGSNGAAFEYTVTKEGKQRTRRRLLLILLYIAWVVIFFTVGTLTRLMLPLLCFIPLSLWIIVFLTWRWTKEEIKLSFLGGTLTVTRMYDGKSPKKLAEVRIKDLELIAKDAEKRLADYPKDSVIYAVRDDSAEGAYIAAWGEQALVFETNEKALKILKYYYSGTVE
ncbi:MAG: hypothetical protein E7668_01160 [Ruminococcaceae bacterium]|nr:hypothetical protein [Oscillospiraceae bacterium]